MRVRAAKYVSFKRSGVFAVLVFLVALPLAQSPPAKAVGTVKSVNGKAVVITTDSGSEVSVTFGDTARIVRATPGQNDLKTAPSIPVSEIQPGDRVLARGQGGESGVVIASSAMVMKQSDIAERQQRERDEWRKGVGGIVKQVDAATGTVTIANAMAVSGKSIVIHIAQATAIRRYSPDSVKFDDAKPGTLDQIKPGDQLRARGVKNADGTELNAQGIVSGRFRDIAGTVISTDAASGTFSVMDLATKKPVSIRVGPDSQLRKLPQMMAQMIALRLRGGTPASAAGQSHIAGQQERPQGAGDGNWNGGGRQPGQPNSGAGGGSGTQGGEGGDWRRNGGGPPDFQQMLSRMPAVSLSDLNKGDAVMLVATEGSSASGPTAITLMAGVEPILSAAPAGTSASTILSPWNLGAPGGGEGPTE